MTTPVMTRVPCYRVEASIATRGEWVVLRLSDGIVVHVVPTWDEAIAIASRLARVAA